MGYSRAHVLTVYPVGTRQFQHKLDLHIGEQYFFVHVPVMTGSVIVMGVERGPVQMFQLQCIRNY